jgi:hypothetical protein
VIAPRSSSGARAPSARVSHASPSRFFAPIVGAAVTLAWPSLALSADPEVTVRAPEVAEVGEPFTVELKVMTSSGSAPSSPFLSFPAGLTGRGPSLSTHSFTSIRNGVRRSAQGLGATWVLRSSLAGTFQLSPQMEVDGAKVSRSITVKVVPKGQGPSPSAGLAPGLGPGFGALGLGPPGWNGAPLGGPNVLAQPLAPDFGPGDDPPYDDALSMPSAPDDKLFLRIVPDKESAVIGEQVTLSYWVYYAVSFDMKDRREPPLSDFVRVPLLKNPGVDRAVSAKVGGKRFQAQLLDRVAVFPTRAGELRSGTMTARFSARGVGSHAERVSNDVVVKVSEPPLAGRPPGYVLGDVGVFRLESLVEPRAVEQGGAVGVTVKVAGSGHFPDKLRVPERVGVEWLDPEVRQSIEPLGGVLTGHRQFQYVVKLHQPGTIELGEVHLPVWNPKRSAYEVAKVDLGKVEVAKVKAKGPSDIDDPLRGSGPEPSAQLGAELLDKLPSPRATLGDPPAAAASLPLGGRFVWGVLAPPALALAGLSGVALGRRLRKRGAQRKGASDTLAKAALSEASSRARAGDTRSALLSLEKAVFHALDAATGLKTRGVHESELGAALEGAGLGPELARAACSFLRDVREAGYAPPDAVDLGEAGERSLLTSGRKLVKKLLP